MPSILLRRPRRFPRRRAFVRSWRQTLVNGRWTLTNALSASIPASVHTLGTPNLLVQAFDNSLPVAYAVEAQLQVVPGSGDVQATFLEPQSGYLLLSNRAGNAYAKSFTVPAGGSVTASAAEHGFATPNLLVQVYDATGDRLRVRVGVHQSTFEVTATLLEAQSGTLVVLPAIPAGTPYHASQDFTATLSVTMLQTTHTLGIRGLATQVYDTAGFEVLGHTHIATNGNVTVTFATPQSGRLVVGGGGIEFVPPVVLTLPAEPGVLTLSGAAAILALARHVACTPGALALSGTAALLAFTRHLGAPPGALVLSGAGSALTLQRHLALGAGALLVSGTDATLRTVRRLTAALGALVSTGTDVALRLHRALGAAAGPLQLQGTDATLRTVRRLPAEASPLLLVGTNAALRLHLRLGAAAGTLQLQGTDAALTGPDAGRVLNAEPGAMLLSGTAAVLSLQRSLLAASGTVVVSGTAAALRTLRRLSATAGVLGLSGTAAALIGPGATRILAAQSGTLTVSATAATLRAVRRLGGTPGLLALQGTAATLVGPGDRRVLAATPGLLALSGADALLRLQRHLLAASGALLVSGSDATLSSTTPPVSVSLGGTWRSVPVMQGTWRSVTCLQGTWEARLAGDVLVEEPVGAGGVCPGGL